MSKFWLFLFSVPAPEELRGGPGEQEPLPVLPTAKVSGARDVQRR